MVLATYYELLKEYISFKTIHDTSTFTSEADKTLQRLTRLFTKHQCSVHEYTIDDTPLLIAQYHQNKNLPTGLIYTNYDLTFQESSSERKNNPFNLYLGKDEIIGRGVAEHKGQFIIYLTSILTLITNEQLGYNITFLIDGTQHKVGTNLTDFLQQHQEELKADFCFCSSGNGVGESPTIEIGQRGGINFDIILSDAKDSSGVCNPILEMSKLLTKFYNVNKIAIPYFYYNVEKAKQETEIKRYGTNLAYRTITKSQKPNHTVLEPTLDITGIISLPKFENSQTIPKKAIANLQMYIVNNQKVQEIINGLHQRLKLIIPHSLKTELIIHEAFNPCKFNLQNPFTQKAIALLSGAFKIPLEYKQKESGLKILPPLQQNICPNIIALPLATESSNINGANEHLKIERVKKGIECCMTFFGK